MTTFHGEGCFFLPTKGRRRLLTSYFLIFGGKQHCKNTWFHGSPLTSVLNSFVNMSAIYLISKCFPGFPVKQSHRPLLEATGASWYTIWSVPTHACHQKHRTTSGISLPNLSAVKLSFAESLKMNQQGVPLMTLDFHHFYWFWNEHFMLFGRTL